MEGVFNKSDPYKLVDSEKYSFKTWDPSELNPDIKEGEAVRRLGYEFLWSHQHKKGADLLPLRFMSDDLVDQCLQKLPFKADQDTLEEVISKRDEDPVFEEFLMSVTTTPSWVDWEVIKKGQMVFLRYLPASLTALMFLSLVGGFGAPKINKVLVSTGYLANKNTLRRLFETTQMIMDCMEPDGLVPMKGVGWFSALRVRFLHGKVRQRLKNSDRWNLQEWGIPINQEDLIATQLSFSFNVLFSLNRIGIPLSKEEVDSYLMLWRYIGFLSGVKEEYNPCTDLLRSKAMTESIVLHLLEPDESSRFLAKHSVESLDVKSPFALSLAGRYQMARMMMGDALADELNLPSSTFHKYHHLLLFFIIKMFSKFTFVPVIGPAIINGGRRLANESLKRMLGGRTSFGMSHVPSNSTINNLGLLKEESERNAAQQKAERLNRMAKVLLLIAVLFVLQKWIRSTGLLKLFRRRLA